MIGEEENKRRIQSKTVTQVTVTAAHKKGAYEQRSTLMKQTEHLPDVSSGSDDIKQRSFSIFS